ncbi:M24 family metallopeptidase [Pseudomonas zhanjiangensis]|uniref:M24 family metallopeptidase n=1 Tax=Pseudomonas zhanjiangensis TaxID=3239015 RepID=A0ABV3YUI9_9PSED
MSNADMIRLAHTSPVMRLTDTEAQIDMRRLRGYRLGRIREQLVARDYGACVLFDPISIRYATGFRNYSLFQMHIPCNYLFIPAQGPVILYESESAYHIANGLETIDECRPALQLNYFFGGSRQQEWVSQWVGEIASLLHEHGGGNRRLAIGRTDARIPLALATSGYTLFDAQELVEAARLIKSREEVLCMNHSLTVAEVGIARMREALVPGMSEIQLWSILHQTNIAMGGEWIDCRLLSSGDRANPWLQEASERIIRPGELVAFDTDMIGPFGYCADVSRTFHCGPGKPTPAQRRLYQLARDEIYHNLELIRPGVSFRELSEKAFKPPTEFIANRYPCIAHGIGMCDENPSIFYPQDFEQHGYDGVIEENMTLCVESYMGAEGGFEGVKLEQQVLVTANGCEVLSRYPLEDDLLA